MNPEGLRPGPVGACPIPVLSAQESEANMSSEGGDRQQQKINDFMRMLPLTLAVAGLPDAEVGKYFNEGQMEIRANTLRNAYKVARQLLLEIAK
jgi:hypothetical protein